MKKLHILAIAVVAIAVAVLSTAAKDVATYANFSDAAKSGQTVKVAGVLQKNKPMEYNPTQNTERFSFFLKDQTGREQKVILTKPKPQDFEASEQVVCTGRFENGSFVANDVLLKCPSKYKDEEIYMKNKK